MTGVCFRFNMSFKEMKTLLTGRLDGDCDLNIDLAPQRWISEKDQLEDQLERSAVDRAD